LSLRKKEEGEKTMICEKCWNEAIMAADSDMDIKLPDTGFDTPTRRTVSEHYVKILRGKVDCSSEEQCGDLHVILIGTNECRCGKRWKDGNKLQFDKGVVEKAV
jgi:hypothetical protein